MLPGVCGVSCACVDYVFCHISSSSVVGFRVRYRMCVFPNTSSPVRVSTIASFASCVLVSCACLKYPELIRSSYFFLLFLLSSICCAVSGRSLNAWLIQSGVPLGVVKLLLVKFRFFMFVVGYC